MVATGMIACTPFSKAVQMVVVALQDIDQYHDEIFFDKDLREKFRRETHFNATDIFFFRFHSYNQ